MKFKNVLIASDFDGTLKNDEGIITPDVIEKIHAKLPNTHMVMHGSSSVPQELQDLINAYGGAIPQTYGVPVEEIVRGIKSGVRKVNVDTDCRMAITGAIRKIFADAGIVWQTAELGKIDVGGGGTVAMYIANHNINTVDLGVPVLSMHAPMEVISKNDLYETHRALCAFCK